MIGKGIIVKSENLTLFIIMIGTIAVMSIFLPDKFSRLPKFQSMASQFPEYGLLALGIMLAMITGGIDLSVVSIANLSGVAGAMVLAAHTQAHDSLGLSSGAVIFLAIIAVLGRNIRIFDQAKITSAIGQTEYRTVTDHRGRRTQGEIYSVTFLWPR